MISHYKQGLIFAQRFDIRIIIVLVVSHISFLGSNYHFIDRKSLSSSQNAIVIFVSKDRYSDIELLKRRD